MSAQKKPIRPLISREEYEEFSARAEIPYEYFGGMIWPKETPEVVFYHVEDAPLREADAPPFKTRGLQIVAMAGAHPNHNRIKRNVETRIDEQLENSPCEVMSGDQKVHIEASDATFLPDVVAFCEDARFSNIGGVPALQNPRVLVEILSPSTAHFDEGDKWAHYQLLPSLRDYLLVSSREIRVKHFFRAGENQPWNERETRDEADEITLGGVPARLRVREIYRRVHFEWAI